MRKVPAATINVLIESLKKLYSADTEVKMIGPHHWAKLYETLVTR